MAAYSHARARIATPAPGIRPWEDARAAQSRVPAATYRLQFRSDFGFRDACRLVPFLSNVGITHIYASPLFEARSGSTHGYDVTDPTRLRQAFGSEEDFNELSDQLKRHRIGLILDIVPNHMAACAENPWWADVLEHGRCSRFAHFFDIDWDCAPPGRLVLPVLGDECGRLLQNGELRLNLDQGGLHLKYWEERFPLRPESYHMFLTGPLEGLAELAGGEPARTNELKAELWQAYSGRQEIREFLDARIRTANVTALLDNQHYRLTYWRSGRNKVNYRRFFDINSLAALRVESEDVFQATHSLLFRLVREGKVQGVRIDHVDGLRDPAAYTTRLSEALRHASRGRQPYIVVEKILLNQEDLPSYWRAQGTTGYDFLDRANRLFVNPNGLPALESVYSRFTGNLASHQQVVYDQKKHVMRELFAGEFNRLAADLLKIARDRGLTGEVSLYEVQVALEELTAALPVYRTYGNAIHLSPRDRRTLEAAFDSAYARTPDPAKPALRFLHRVFTVQYPPFWNSGPEPPELQTLLRWQQLTGPVMAKGMEDTVCYLHNSLVSLNVVGGGRNALTVEDFHGFNSERQARWPSTLNATSTHDTKRSEDVRARISVLSEVSGEWEKWLKRWSAWNRGKKQAAGGHLAPCASDEVLLYQVLLGAWPLSADCETTFKQRVCDFMIKAAREAKAHTSWIGQNCEYENAVVQFVTALLTPGTDNPFLPDLRRAIDRIAPFGAASSLAQMLLKITSPGVPDFYQGCLLWDFSLVDPDNRRAVDFDLRMQYLERLRTVRGDRLSRARELRSSWQDGRIKLYTAAEALKYRSEHSRVFQNGEYIPLQVHGAAREHVVAFARRSGTDWALVVVPRLLASLSLEQDPFAASDTLRGVEVELPAAAPARWRNVFTGEELFGSRISASHAFANYPVALFSGFAETAGRS